MPAAVAMTMERATSFAVVSWGGLWQLGLVKWSFSFQCSSGVAGATKKAISIAVRSEGISSGLVKWSLLRSSVAARHSVQKAVHDHQF